MPAASEPTGPAPVELPRTWRPLGTRIAILVSGIMLLTLAAAAWFLLADDIRAAFSWFQRITIVLFVVGAGSVGWAFVRCRVTATAEHLVVVNGYRRHEYDWAQVVAARMPPGAPWVRLDLADGTTRAALGIQASDGARATAAVRDLRRLIDRS